MLQPNSFRTCQLAEAVHQKDFEVSDFADWALYSRNHLRPFKTSYHSMELQHVNIKIFAAELQVDLERFIEIFHRWIADKMTSEMLIDVADYRHVPDGPGVVLVGHEADYALDNAGGQLGLLYNRKDAIAGSNKERLKQSLRSAAWACQQLESELEGETLQFNRQEFAIIINDRALAPNTDETMATVKPELEAFLSETLGHDQFSMERQFNDPRCRFGVVVRAAQSFDLTALAS